MDRKIKKRKKGFLSLLLAVLLTFSGVPVTAQAQTHMKVDTIDELYAGDVLMCFVNGDAKVQYYEEDGITLITEENAVSDASNPFTGYSSTILDYPDDGEDAKVFKCWEIIYRDEYSGSALSGLQVKAVFYKKSNITYVLNGGTNGANPGTYYEGKAVITLQAASGKEGYSFAGWYDNSQFSGNRVTEISKDDTGNKIFYARWASKDAGVTAVSVSGTEGTKNGTTFSVVLPYGSTIPTDATAVSVTAAAGATQTVPVTSDNGATWTFTVTAEDGTTTENYTVNVSVAPDPAAENEADVAAAKARIENADWTVPQEIANSKEAVKTWIEQQLGNMDLNGAGFDVTITDTFTEAVAGNAENRDGTNGSFDFTVKIYKGQEADSIATGDYAEEDVTVSDVTITATVFRIGDAPHMPGNTISAPYSNKKVGDVTLPEGWAWQEADQNKLLEVGIAVSATAVYTGADAGYYENVTASVTITRSACNHVSTEVRNAKEATCGEKGYTGDTCCKVCGEKTKAGTSTAALGHDYVGKVTKESTTESEGTMTYTCSRCGDSYTERIPKAEFVITADEKQANSVKLDMGARMEWKNGQINVTWGAVPGADGYEIFATECGKEMDSKSLAVTVAGDQTQTNLAKIAGKKLSGTKSYKVKIKAFKMVNGKKVNIGISRTYHMAGKNNEKYTNAKKVKIAEKSVVLKEGKTAKIKATIVKQSKEKSLFSQTHGASLRYYSTDESIATVTEKGKIKAKKAGTCYIYITALNGVSTRVKVTVKNK